MILEIRRRPFGVGAFRASWPKASHFILRVGPIESRVIVPHGEPVGVWGILTIATAGLLLGLVGKGGVA